MENANVQTSTNLQGKKILLIINCEQLMMIQSNGGSFFKKESTSVYTAGQALIWALSPFNL